MSGATGGNTTHRNRPKAPSTPRRLHGPTATDLRLSHTVVTSRFTGRPARSIRNRFLDELATTEPLPWPLQRIAAEDIYSAAVERDDEQLFPLLAGQGLRALADGQPAGEIVAEIAEQAAAVLDSLAADS